MVVFYGSGKGEWTGYYQGEPARVARGLRTDVGHI